MSAFMVSEECMARVIDALNYAGHVKEPGELFEMNKRALEARYPGRYPEMKKYRKRFKHSPRPLTTKAELCAALKSLHCYLYQCSEGDVPGEELFKHCVAAAEILGPLAGCTRDGPDPAEYEAAPWG